MDKAVQIPRIKMRDVSRVYDTMEVGILIADHDGTLIWGNQYYSYLAGFDIRNYFGTDVRKLSQKEDMKLAGNVLMIDVVLKTHKKYSEVIELSTDDYIIATASPVKDPEGNIDYIVYTFMNYNELSDLQKQLTQSTMQVLALESQINFMQLCKDMDKDIVVVDGRMYRIYGKALRMAQTDVSVLLTGETGVGKDVLAKFIHRNSTRKDHPFIHVNLATIPKSLFESELFGYSPGAFTGAAAKGKAGLISLANGGTLFLDEIGEIPLDIQTKLLQVIQDKKVRAIGMVDDMPVDFRIVCATNKNLAQMVENNEFRRDLYYRINAIEIKVPPLRERPDDIPMLAAHFLKKYNEKHRTKRHFDSFAIQAFLRYDWPGNVRELQHVIESMLVLSTEDTLSSSLLPDEIHSFLSDAELNTEHLPEIGLKQAVENYEKKLMESALNHYSTALEAANALKIDASTFSKKRKKYGI